MACSKSFGLTHHYHNAYFVSNWNRLDAVVVLFDTLFCVATLAGWNFVMYEALSKNNKPESTMYFMIVVLLCSFFSLNLIKAEKDGSVYQTKEQALCVSNQRLRISLYPTYYSPSNSPTISPSNSPSLSPHDSPSISPTQSPSIAPPISLSVSPTNIHTMDDSFTQMD